MHSTPSPEDDSGRRTLCLGQTNRVGKPGKERPTNEAADRPGLPGSMTLQQTRLTGAPGIQGHGSQTTDPAIISTLTRRSPLMPILARSKAITSTLHMTAGTGT